MKYIKRITAGAAISMLMLSCSNLSTRNEKNLKPFAQEAQKGLFLDYSLESVRKNFAENYIQHNPHVPTGRAPIEGFLPLLKKSKTTYKTHRLLQDGNFVIMHNTYDNAQAFGAKEVATFDIWRIENGKVAEHWDVIQPLGKANGSGRTLVDGATKIEDLDKTDENKELVHNFYHDVFVKGNKAAAKKYINPKKYIQHNPYGKDGLKSFEAFLDDYLAKPYKPAKIHRVLGEGNFVVVVVEAVEEGKNVAVYDLFRVENDQIVEHWDIIQEIPKKMAHQNGMF
jgi:predicted SnoaL-like aldol condensation-catalyzing enzyme